MKRIFTWLACAFGVLACAPAFAQEGQTLFQANCVACHNGTLDRAPTRDAFASMAPEQILAAMEVGSMVTMAVTLSTEQRRALAEFLAGKPLSVGVAEAAPASAMCAKDSREFTLAGPRWNGWGVTASNSRYQDAESAGLSAADIPRLRVKWAFGFPGDIRAYAPPMVAGGRVFFGSGRGQVYSLDADSGCIHWFANAGASVRSAITIARLDEGDRHVLFFGDQSAFVHALDAVTGETLWKTKVDDYPTARVTGSPALHGERLYVPVASGEEAAGASPTYECCRFRGSLVALDARTGRQIWKTYTLPTPQPTQKNAVGTQMWGPSGAPIWSSPAIDPLRNAVYVTTGNNYSDPTSELSDAFIAMNLDSGEILWAKQMTPADAYTAACRLQDRTNCAASDGPDFDFGASPILVTLPSGRRALVAGQKSGVVHALDPDRGGEIIWQTRVGKGGTMGGVQWGSAVDAANIYVAVSDLNRIPVPFAWGTDADPKVGGGMFALRITDGAQLWYTPPAPCGERPRCSPAQPGAVSAMPGVAFSGSMDGHLRAYSTSDGKVLWDFDTVRSYETVNGITARGGSLDGPGPTIAGGIVFANSGYPSGGGIPGNVLLAFSVDGQ